MQASLVRRNSNMQSRHKVSRSCNDNSHILRILLTEVRLELKRNIFSCCFIWTYKWALLWRVTIYSGTSTNILKWHIYGKQTEVTISDEALQIKFLFLRLNFLSSIARPPDLSPFRNEWPSIDLYFHSRKRASLWQEQPVVRHSRSFSTDEWFRYSSREAFILFAFPPLLILS